MNLIITTPEPPLPPKIVPLLKEPPPPPPVCGNPADATPVLYVMLGTPPPPLLGMYGFVPFITSCPPPPKYKLSSNCI